MDEIVLSEPGLSVTIRSSEGGAIVSLIAQDREWLVQGPPRGEPSASASYVDAGPRGWDEMAPTIDPCNWGGRQIPDHGDAWRSAWRHVDESTLRFSSPLGYQLERRAEIRATRLHLDYLLTAEQTTMPVLWAAHPLVTAEPGTVVQLTGYAGELVDVTRAGHPVQSSPPPGWSNIDAVPLGEYRKYVLPPDRTQSSAKIIHPDGAWIRFQWTADVVPYLGVYLERHAFTDASCIAIEPMTGWWDSLERAVTNNQVLRLASGERVRWSVVVDFGPGE